MPRIRIQVQGTVQGVGFRPFVYRLALDRRLTGWVRNRPDGVEVEVQGAEPALQDFLRALRSDLPAPARIERLATSAQAEVVGEAAFMIASSGAGEGALPVVPPDLATCAECAAETAAPGERRHRYPFTNCTFCGPRYSIIEALPYDRRRTSMKGFPLCPDCAREYGDPLDRRFHAQPVACPTCGPRLEWRTADAPGLAFGEGALQAAGASLRAGQVVALKGLGGYQLLVDAGSAAAVAELRRRKRRGAKPFAVMFPDLAALLAACEASPEEQALLQGPEAPIVLLLRRNPLRAEPAIDPAVAPGNPRIGAFLPYTPLHSLLMEAAGRPLVCTSGNLGEEPMAFQDDEALLRLRGLADRFLVHDRPVVRPVDDSVLRLDADGPTLLRRARGYAPRPLPMGGDGPPVLAFGAQQKNTVALLFEGRMVVSQHLGDLASPASALLLERTVEDLLAFFRVAPEALACDLHPDFASTRLAERFARERGLPLLRVQHHHAHAAACAAEHRLEGPCLALAWDGTGLGSDGTLWGGEALRIEGASFRRIGYLRPFPLPGGDRAAREPRRSAAGLLWSCLGAKGWPEIARSWWTEAEFQLLQCMLRQDLNCPRSSSLGRLFDAVAALTGLQAQAGFEGQAAMALEFAAGSAAPAAGLPWEWAERDGCLVADPGPMLEALLTGRWDPAALARRFHEGLADLALAWARHAGLGRVVLAGGCFQNALLTALVTERLAAAGFQVHRHRLLPPNDGSISAGQAVLALAAQRG